MTDLQQLKSDLERERRSLAMLSPAAPLSRETAIALIERCQRAIDAVTRSPVHLGPDGPISSVS